MRLSSPPAQRVPVELRERREGESVDMLWIHRAVEEVEHKIIT